MFNISNFQSYMPTRVIFGKNCILENKDTFKEYSRVFIVTGKNSAKKSGALDDITSVLSEAGKKFEIFDKIMENPLLSVCHEGGQAANSFNADLILGIGGGSPLDAAKAIALFAANPNLPPENIFTPPYENASLPIFVIPTTAGTGSEANPYSILTLDGKDQKKTFNHAYSYPKIAFLDPKYTFSLPQNTTISTALDAFCHCIESRLSPKSTPISTGYASSGAKILWEVLKDIRPENFNLSESKRESLLLGSLFGGLAINATGTGFPHPMGYNLTFEYDLPHGKACAVFLGEYLRLNNEAAPELCGTIFSELNSPLSEISSVTSTLADFKAKPSDEVIQKFISRINTAANFKNSPHSVSSDAEIGAIYERVLQG